MASILRDKIRKDICEAIAAGVSREGAAHAAGVSSSTLYRWIKRGEAEIERIEQRADGETVDDPEDTTMQTERCMALVVAIWQAEAKFERESVEQLLKRQQRWQSLAWLLARRFPKIYGSLLDADESGGGRSGVVVLPELDSANDESAEKVD
jgi:hypothetical protein